MFGATAAGTASIQHVGVPYSSGQDPNVIERYVRWVTRSKPQLSDNKPEAYLYAPSPVQPKWLETTQRSIRESLLLSAREGTDGGRWLSQQVVNAANDFFQGTSDILPGEPFIYSSQKGDLVAEFQAEHGTMTSIVSSAFVLLFAVIDGVPIERRVLDHRDLREEVRRLTELLRTGQHGALETRE